MRFHLGFQFPPRFHNPLYSQGQLSFICFREKGVVYVYTFCPAGCRDDTGPRVIPAFLAGGIQSLAGATAIQHFRSGGHNVAPQA